MKLGGSPKRQVPLACIMSVLLAGNGCEDEVDARSGETGPRWQLEIEEVGTLPVCDAVAYAMDAPLGRVCVSSVGTVRTGRCRSLETISITGMQRETLAVAGNGPVHTAVGSMTLDDERSHLYLFGGWPYGAEMPSDQLHRVELDRKDLEWSPVRRQAPWPAARNGAGMVYDRKADCLLLFGGDAGGGVHSFTPLSDLWRFDLKTGEWSKIRPRGITPPARWHLMMTVDIEARRAFMFGGAGIGFQGLDNNLYALDLDTYRWQVVATTGDKPVSPQGGTLTYDTVNRALVLIGGLRHEGPGDATISSVWVFDTVNDSWEHHNGGDLIKRRDHVGVYDPLTRSHFCFGGKQTTEIGNWYSEGRHLRNAVRVKLSRSVRK